MMQPRTHSKNSYCSYCGHPFGVNQLWPRQCSRCQNISFANPAPVVVLLVSVDDGVLAIRRGIEPRAGWLALPGGYIEVGETWQKAGTRELYEEAGILLDPATVRELRVFSPETDILTVVGIVPPLRRVDLPTFMPTPEATERIILTAPIELAFPLHTEVLTQFLRGRS